MKYKDAVRKLGSDDAMALSVAVVDRVVSDWNTEYPHETGPRVQLAQIRRNYTERPDPLARLDSGKNGPEGTATQRHFAISQMLRVFDGQCRNQTNDPPGHFTGELGHWAVRSGADETHLWRGLAELLDVDATVIDLWVSLARDWESGIAALDAACQAIAATA